MFGLNSSRQLTWREQLLVAECRWRTQALLILGQHLVPARNISGCLSEIFLYVCWKKKIPKKLLERTTNTKPTTSYIMTDYSLHFFFLHNVTRSLLRSERLISEKSLKFSEFFRLLIDPKQSISQRYVTITCKTRPNSRERSSFLKISSLGM